MKILLLAAALTVCQGTQIRLQVDDIHKLYINGVEKSNNFQWTSINTVNVAGNIGSMAIYAENIGGPGGVLMTIDGQPADFSQWKCKTVDNLANANKAFAGWSGNSFNTAGWKAAVSVDGAKKSFNGGNWWWSPDGGMACICRYDKQTQIKLQVDDIHRLFINGEQKSSNNKWTAVNTINFAGNIGSMAIYAKNIGGPGGVLMTIDGQPADFSQWKCKTVTNLAKANQAFPGWSGNSFNTAGWKAAVSVTGDKKSFNGGNWWWSPDGGMECICRFNAPLANSLSAVETEFKMQIDDVHKFYLNGELVTTDNQWRSVTTINVGGPIISTAIYAKNIGGPRGIMLTVNGQPVNFSQWKCMTVNSLAQAPKGWNSNSFNDDGWKKAVAVVGASKSFEGGDWWWSADGGDQCICRRSY